MYLARRPAMNSVVRNPGRVKMYRALVKNFPSKCRIPSSPSSTMCQKDRL
jgi:hypothetical protein